LLSVKSCLLARAWAYERRAAAPWCCPALFWWTVDAGFLLCWGPYYLHPQTSINHQNARWVKYPAKPSGTASLACTPRPLQALAGGGKVENFMELDFLATLPTLLEVLRSLATPLTPRLGRRSFICTPTRLPKLTEFTYTLIHYLIRSQASRYEQDSP
jgi:hypothetical protein